jgi:hypothetical protein
VPPSKLTEYVSLLEDPLEFKKGKLRGLHWESFLDGLWRGDFAD